jgi:hypothetical protein
MTVANVIYFYSTKNVGKYVTESLCVYFGEKSGKDVLSFYSILEEGLKSCNTLPDCMVIICSDKQMNDFARYWQDKEENKNFLNRTVKNGTKYTKDFYFVEINESTIELNKTISSLDGITQLVESDLVNILGDGLKSLVERNSAVHIAPAGHSFKHPSGKISKLFIQTRELTSSEVELQFTARVMHLLSSFKWSELDVIYIDTMGIYSIVKQALIYTKGSAEIRSFHSYDSLDTVTKPSLKSAVIISASTSGGMAKNLINKGWEAHNIITIIDTSLRENISSVLIDLSKLDKNIGKNSIDGNETDIELVGENFSYKAKPAKQITLGIPHNPKYLKDILEVFKNTGVNKLNSSTNTKKQLLSLNPVSLIYNKKFNSWLDNELCWGLPISVNCIVHASDESSTVLACRAKNIITGFYQQEVMVIPSNELSKESIANATGILIISTFSGDGGVFREISRDLREFEENFIPRHFLAGVGIPQSKDSWTRLNQFLVRNATEREYNFSTWKVLAIGADSISNSWVELGKLAAKSQNIDIPNHSKVSEKLASQSFENLVDVVRKSQNSLLPSSLGQRLKITEGFVFFGDIYDENEVTNAPQSDVLLTISSVLQAAREHKNPNNCLKPTNYQSVIISPETFLRFNDDILQACILRACLPSELDYSSDKHMSEIMSEFVLKIFIRHEHSFGYAALEFAAALSTGKLKLKNEHQKELIDKAITAVSSESSALLGFLLMCLD